MSESETAPAPVVDTPLKAWVRALEMTAPDAPEMSLSFPSYLELLAKRFGSAPALLSSHQCLSYEALARRLRQYARWAKDQGLRTGDVVCLLAANSPEYLAIWAGLTRAGAVVALLNSNLTGPALAHSINVVSPTWLILGEGFADAVRDMEAELSSGPKRWTFGDDNNSSSSLETQLSSIGADTLPAEEFPEPELSSRALYIYTSGTTGFPKAAGVSHHRLQRWCRWFAGMLGVRDTDRMYNCLPMYHSVGGVVAVGAALVNGGSVFLRERFSASQFWDEVVTWECTLFQYIGELCRYLNNSPPHPKETAHKLRLCCGNGLRRDVWETFQTRFKIPRILEFYAATEANFSLYNCEGEPGAIGRIPPFLAHRFPVAIVKFDPESCLPFRDADGYCVRCSPDEPGEAIGAILEDEGHTTSRFEGYSDRGASEAKIFRNVFAAGDAWFRTGDLMRRDKRGYYYFVDRVGDTFRWKGENVSTAEVAEALAAFPSVQDAAVYGVRMERTEGRAGMAALVVDEDFDLVAFRAFIAQRLPDYARPLFLRFRSSIEITSTFKAKKQDLAGEGYDPSVVADALYFDDRAQARFVPLDVELFARVNAGEIRL